MKKFLKVVLCCAVLATGTSAVSAQGIGGLIKKGKAAVKKGEKAVDKILGKEDSSENESSSESKTVTSSGIVISNPISEFIEIEPIGLYGVSTSEDFGDAYLVLKVKNLTPKEVTNFGSRVQNQNMIAVDTKGKVYNVDAYGHFGYDTPEGIMVTLSLNEPGIMFTHINKDIDMMQQVKVGVFSDAYHQGNIVLNNVPIFWDEVPE